MMNDADDSAWMSAIDELGDNWVEDDVVGTLSWEAARHRRQQSPKDAGNEPVDALPSAPAA